MTINNSNNQCPICGRAIYQDIHQVGLFPYFTVPISSQDKAEILNKYTCEELMDSLDLSACYECGHIFLTELPDLEVLDKLYSKYYSYPSPLEGAFKPERDNRFLEIFEKEDNKDYIF